MSYQPRNVLITGGAGFIGSNFIRHLLKNDKEVQIINLDLLTYAGSLHNVNNLQEVNRYKFIQGDIGDSPLIEKILREYEVDTIIHFAAESHVDRSIAGPAQFIHTNVLGTFSLLESAKRYWLGEKKWDASRCRFHHISTDEVYGSLTSDANAFSEESRYAPNSPYSASKAGSDHLVRAYFHTYQLPVTLSHCSNNYGPYQHPEKFIPTVIMSCLEDRSIPIYGKGENVRDWIYVEDHCSGVLAVLKKGKLGEVYHLGGQYEVNNLHVAKQICRLMDEHFPKNDSHLELISFVTDRPGHDWRYAMDITKAKQELGWSPQESFENGLKKTIFYYQEYAKIRSF